LLRVGLTENLGEFAVMAYADRTSRVKWYDFISDAALERGFACSVWDNGVFGSLDNDMAIYNRDTRTFDTEILNALFSPTPRPTKPPVTPAVGEKMLDDFEGVLNWGSYSGEGAKVSTKIVSGKTGNRTATGEQYTVYRTAIGQNGLKSLLTLSPLTVAEKTDSFISRLDRI